MAAAWTVGNAGLNQVLDGPWIVLGLPPEYLDEIEGLVNAPGLFSSTRTATEALRDKLEYPFPRPDDPLASARQKAVNSRGGNGFRTVAATHAAARYGGFIRASLPPFWTTYDPEVVRSALKRLDEARTR